MQPMLHEEASWYILLRCWICRNVNSENSKFEVYEFWISYQKHFWNLWSLSFSWYSLSYFGNSSIWIPCQGCAVCKNLKFQFDFPAKSIFQKNFRFRLIQKSGSLPFSWGFSLFNFENQTKSNWVRGKIVGPGVEILNHVLTKFENVPAAPSL